MAKKDNLFEENFRIRKTNTNIILAGVETDYLNAIKIQAYSIALSDNIVPAPDPVIPIEDDFIEWPNLSNTQSS